MLLNELTNDKAMRLQKLLADLIDEKELYLLQQEVFEDILQNTKAKVSLEQEINLIELSIQQSVLEDKALTNETLRRSAKQQLEQSHEVLQMKYNERLQQVLRAKALDFLLSQTNTLLN